ncbi:MAG: cell division protein FtsW [Lachnospiraceae bacterium]|nr:cell division protein FtsW [Lachnospiraceae bacterium]
MAGRERTARNYRESALRPHAHYDYSLFFLVVFLVGFGLVMIYSASAYRGMVRFNDSMHFLKRQGISVIVGLVAMIVLSRIDYRIWSKPLIKKTPINLALLAYLFCVALQVLVLIIGEEYNGAKRWIKVPVLGTFQPSELSKVATVLFVAYIVSIAPKKLDKFSGFVRVALYMAPLLALIAKENLSSAIIVGGIMVAICFVASRKKLYYLIVGAGGLAGIFAYIKFVGYRAERVEIWRNIETHPKGMQILQGLYAISAGGLFGTGLGQSMQKLGAIPEAYNDMIFTIICEELGVFGAVIVIVLFVLLLWRMFVIAISAPDLFGGLICAGVMAQVAIQVIINIAVVTNSIPSTGIPLPFISYGGTSVMILLAEMGLVLSVSNEIDQRATLARREEEMY